MCTSNPSGQPDPILDGLSAPPAMAVNVVRSRPRQVPKAIGADCEVSTYLENRDAAVVAMNSEVSKRRRRNTNYEATLMLHGKIRGHPTRCRDEYIPAGFDGTAWGFSDPGSFQQTGFEEDGDDEDTFTATSIRRQFLRSGICLYCDMSKWEYCLPLTTSTRLSVALERSCWTIMRRAQEELNQSLKDGWQAVVLLNTSDGFSHAQGCHRNVLVTRECFDNLFHKQPLLGLYFSGLLACSVIFGLGKIGSEFNRSPARYQMGQKADAIEVYQGYQTVMRKPLLNLRDEPHLGSRHYGWTVCDGRGGEHKPPRHDLARVHITCLDNRLQQVSAFLVNGILQMSLALIEAEECVDTSILLHDPVEALHTWSHDPTLRARARLMNSSKSVTALELMFQYLEAFKKACRLGVFDGGIVPEAKEVLELLESTLVYFRERKFTSRLKSRIDWISKLYLIQHVRKQLNIGFDDYETLKVYDHFYSSLGDDGLFFGCERDGLAEQLVTPEEVAFYVEHPPGDSRAYTRGRLLGLCEQTEGAEIDSMDWDFIRVRFRENGQSRYLILPMNDPLGMTERDTQHLFDGAGANLEQVLLALGAREVERRRRRWPGPAQAGPVYGASYGQYANERSAVRRCTGGRHGYGRSGAVWTGAAEAGMAGGREGQRLEDAD